jgi:hypothetical protein
LLSLPGIPIGEDDARRLVATLLAEGQPDALTAAEQLTLSVEPSSTRSPCRRCRTGDVAASD